MYTHTHRCNDLIMDIGFKINPWEWGIDVLDEIVLAKS